MASETWPAIKARIEKKRAREVKKKARLQKNSRYKQMWGEILIVLSVGGALYLYIREPILVTRVPPQF